MRKMGIGHGSTFLSLKEGGVMAEYKSESDAVSSLKRNGVTVDTEMKVVYGDNKRFGLKLLGLIAYLRRMHGYTVSVRPEYATRRNRH